MSEIKHTPGPWAYRKADDHDGYDIDSDNGNGPGDWIGLARVEKFADYAKDDDKEPARCAAESLANARLISSAPELLACLEKLVPSDNVPAHIVQHFGPDSVAVYQECRSTIAKAKGE